MTTETETIVFEAFDAKIANKIRSKYLPLLVRDAKKDGFTAEKHLADIAKKHQINVADKAFVDFWMDLRTAAVVVAENRGHVTSKTARAIGWGIMAFAGIGAATTGYIGYRFFANGGDVAEAVAVVTETAAA